MLLRDLSETGDDCGHRRIVAEVAELLQEEGGLGEVKKRFWVQGLGFRAAKGRGIGEVKKRVP